MHRERYSPQDTARHASKGLASALAESRQHMTWRRFMRELNTAWRIGHHAGRLFALRERAREAHEAKGGER